MKKVLYTCITNGYDRLREVKADGWEKVCFTDSDIKSESWVIEKIANTDKIFREIKICPHNLFSYDKCIWIDGRMQVDVDLNEFIKDKEGLWLMDHPVRDCAYEEARACIESRKDDPSVIKDQVTRYKNDGFPENFGLVATGVILRDWDEEINEFMDLWWGEVKSYSVRDQISFPYCVWRHPINYKTFPFCEGFINWTHKKPKKQ